MKKIIVIVFIVVFAVAVAVVIVLLGVEQDSKKESPDELEKIIESTDRIKYFGTPPGTDETAD